MAVTEMVLYLPTVILLKQRYPSFGNIGGQPFWSWYGFSSRVSGAPALSAGARIRTGYHSRRNTPSFSYCDSGIAWFKRKRTCGRMAGMSLSPATLFSLTGTETVYPTM